MELNMAISWEKFLEKEFSKDYFKALSSFIASERKENPNSIFPDENKVFEALKNCSLEKVKVVIIGQRTSRIIVFKYGEFKSLAKPIF